MKLLIIRHAIAMEREEFHRINTDDGLRPLTAEGIKKMKKNAQGLRELVPNLDILVSSPLVRAVQTAEIVSSAYDSMDYRKRPELLPERHPSDLLEWLKNLPARGPSNERLTVAAIGHEPHLTRTISWLLSGNGSAFVELRKGGACLLEFKKSFDAGKAQLLWLLKPSQLRLLRKVSLKENP